MKLRYTVEGSGASDVPYALTGIIDGESVVDPATQQAASMAAFRQLTAGAATFGEPGQGGCRGPYVATRFLIEVVE